MAQICEDITATVGKTPLVRLKRLAGPNSSVLAKIEAFNPTASVKDRTAVAMIEAAEREGAIDKDTVLIEPTSGNMGVGLACVCAARGYKLMLVMPETTGAERRKLLRILGAEVVLTSAMLGMTGAVQEAGRLCREIPNAYLIGQFTNPANPEIHRRTTAVEIWNDTNGRVDIFVAGVGTGGTLTGCGRLLRQKKPQIRIVAVEPAGSAVLSGGQPGFHKIQGIGPGFIPEVLDTSVYDEVVPVTNEQAIETTRELARQEGILGGISSGAAAYVACELSRLPENKGKTIVFMVCDTAERYLSTELFANL
ncbi:MAG: cysteine synthase A [Planctomycetes bacterium]|nr:cysteine synthase A [Planctomycetota bacterium]